MISRRTLPGYPFERQIEELRKRVFVCVVFLFVFWVVLFYYFPKLVPLFLRPYAEAVGGNRLVFTTLPEAVMVALKATFFLALIATFPVILYQAWAYIAPALYPNERQFLKKLLFIAPILFFSGIVFSYLFFLPAVLKFFLSFGLKYFDPNLKVAYYFSFVGKFLLVSGLLCLLPLGVAFLHKAELVKRSAKTRLYLLGGLFLFSAFLCPGDFFSQLLVFLFLFLLFELGGMIAKLL